MREADLPYLYFFGGLLTFFTARLIGRLADRYGKRRLFGIVATISIIPRASCRTHQSIGN